MTASDDPEPLPAPSSVPPLRPEPWDYLETLSWRALATVLAVFALPQIPVAMVLAVLAPWFLSRHGVLINGEPHLYAPLHEVIPGPLWWPLVVSAIVLLALCWSTSVRFLVLDRGGHRSPLRAALRSAPTALPATLAAFILPVGLYLSVDLALGWSRGDAHPVWTVVLWALLFLFLPPVWHPAAGVALGPGAWREVLSELRRRPSRPVWVSALLVPPASLAMVSLSGSAADDAGGVALTWVLALVGLTVSAIALTLVSQLLQDTARFQASAEPGEGTSAEVDPSSGDGARGRTNTRLRELGRRAATPALVAAVLLGVSAPAPLFERVLTDGPWDIPGYDRWTSTAEEAADEELPLSLASDGSVVFLGEARALCDLPEGCAGPGATDDGSRPDPVPRPGDAGAGSVVLETPCGGGTDCDEREVLLVPDREVDGERDADEDDAHLGATTPGQQDGTLVWAERIDGRDHAVSSVPLVDRDESMVTLFVCQDTDCDDYTATELTRLAAAPRDDWIRSRGVYPKLVDIAGTPDGGVRVTLHDPGSGELTLFSCDADDCAGVAETVLVPPASVTRAADVHYRLHAGAEVEVRPDGTPVILYRDTLDGSVRLLDCADELCAESEAVEVFGPGWDRPAPALALDSDGSPRILGHDLAARELVYVMCADASCSDSESVTVGAYPDSPGWVRLLIDPENRPVMAWLRDTAEESEEASVELLRCGDSSCTMLGPTDDR
ncbi:hypothetical protein ACFXKD_21590 [Nocardiopsis aegyptia]|uniref:hypothetical protein n=1 Tax=Nocardiopsis aegyptia TaxID=220378 RepID=UPI00366FCE2E